MTNATTPPLTAIEGSSAVTGYSYDPAVKLLHIQHKKDGPAYPYYGVPQSVVDGFLAAESMGRFLGSQIRGKYPSTPPADEA